jgi:hypothetical protein
MHQPGKTPSSLFAFVSGNMTSTLRKLATAFKWTAGSPRVNVDCWFTRHDAGTMDVHIVVGDADAGLEPWSSDGYVYPAAPTEQERQAARALCAGLGFAPEALEAATADGDALQLTLTGRPDLAGTFKARATLGTSRGTWTYEGTVATFDLGSISQGLV